MKSSLIYFLSLNAIVEANLRDTAKSENFSYINEVIQGSLLLTHNVIVVLDELLDDKGRRISDAIVSTIAENRPMQLIDTLPNSWPKDMYGTSYTLYVGIVALNYPILLKHFKSIIDKMLSTMNVFHYPKVLLVILVNRQTKEFRAFFENLLRLVDLLDVTILEILSSGDFNENGVLVHRYNPFNATYDKTSFIKKGISWFPDKTKNLHGSDFEICIPDNYYSNYGGEKTFLFYVDGSMSVLETAMNLTFAFKISRGHRCNMHHPSAAFHSSGLITTVPRDYTIPLGVSQTCLIIPILENSKGNMAYLNVIITVVAGISIVVVLFVFMSILRIHPNVRHPVVIFGSMLNVSWPRSPSNKLEKIFFFVLIIVASRYTAMFYTELFNAAIQNPELFDIKSFEDLENSELFFSVSEELVENFDFTLYPKLKEKLIPVKIKSSEDYFAWMEHLTQPEAYINTGHFVEENIMHSITFVTAFNANYSHVTIATDFCVGIQAVSYAIKLRNPYKGRINELLIRSRELGFHQKYTLLTFANALTEYTKKVVNDYLFKKDTLPVVTYMLYAYVMILVVFAGEIAFYHIQQRIRFRRLKATLANTFSKSKRSVY